MPDKTPIMEIVEKLDNPDNLLSDEERNKIKSLTGDVGSAVKTSLISLMMGQFTKIAAYDNAVNKILKTLTERIEMMEPEELITFLGVLTKTSASESKTVLELFKKQGDDFKAIVDQLQKISITKEKVINEEGEEVSEELKPIINLSQNKKDKVLRLMERLGKSDEEQ